MVLSGGMQISVSEGKGSGPGQVVYTWHPLPADAEEQYNMTGMALSLNNPHPGLLRELPPTDSRLRPDQRELELGHTEEATSEKLRLEEKQRESRRIRKVHMCFQSAFRKLDNPHRSHGAGIWCPLGGMRPLRAAVTVQLVTAICCDCALTTNMTG